MVISSHLSILIDGDDVDRTLRRAVAHDPILDSPSVWSLCRVSSRIRLSDVCKGFEQDDTNWTRPVGKEGFEHDVDARELGEALSGDFEGDLVDQILHHWHSVFLGGFCESVDEPDEILKVDIVLSVVVSKAIDQGILQVDDTILQGQDVCAQQCFTLGSDRWRGRSNVIKPIDNDFKRSRLIDISFQVIRRLGRRCLWSCWFSSVCGWSTSTILSLDDLRAQSPLDVATAFSFFADTAAAVDVIVVSIIRLVDFKEGCCLKLCVVNVE